MDPVREATQFLTDWKPASPLIKDDVKKRALIQKFKDAVGVDTDQKATDLLKNVQKAAAGNSDLLVKIDKLMRIINVPISVDKSAAAAAGVLPPLPESTDGIGSKPVVALKDRRLRRKLPPPSSLIIPDGSSAESASTKESAEKLISFVRGMKDADEGDPLLRSAYRATGTHSIVGLVTLLNAAKALNDQEPSSEINRKINDFITRINFNKYF